MRKEVIGDATLYLGDCLEILPTLPKVDAVITDPPYSSGGMVRGDRAQGTKTKYLQSDSSNHEKLSEFSGDNRDQRGFHFWSALWSSAAMRVSKPGAPACFFTDWRQLPVSTDYMQAGGWVWRGVVPWAKPSYRPQMGRFGAQCEYLVWGSNGPMPVERGVGCLPGFFDHCAPQDREHVTQKPVGMMGEIVQIVPAGSLVLDPFMGSGTTGVACVEQGRAFIGIELTPDHFSIACRRIEQAYKQRPLFEAEPARKPEQVDLLALCGNDAEKVAEKKTASD
jgi:site-specific DNA-methyltransferase (adenine-specific)